MDIKKTDENHVALLAHVILFWAENFGIKTTQYAFKANISRSIKVNNSTRHGHIQLTNATILNKILCFFLELEISFPHSKKSTTGHHHRLDQMRS